MANIGRQLGAIQYRGHLAIDDIYAPLADDIALVVLRRPALDNFGVLVLLAAIQNLLGPIAVPLTREVMDTATEAGTLGDRAYVGPSLATQDAIFTSLKKAETPVLRQVRRVIMEGVTGHKTLEMIAKQLHDYFSPWFTFRRAPMGGKLRANRVGAVNRWPGSSGMASQHVRTTMLTTSTAQHAAAVRGYARRNTEGMQWHLAPGHVDADDCDTHARADVGYGQGIYLPDEAPDLPSHFRCRCHYESVPL